MQSESKITIYGETNRTIEFIPTPELLTLLDLAALINQRANGQFNYSFGALLIAFAHGMQGINNWFGGYIEKNSINLGAIFEYQRFPGDSAAVREFIGKLISVEDIYKNQQRTATASSLDWLEEAKRRSRQQEHEKVGLRHMMGAIIFAPKFHKSELKSWGFRRPHWAAAYLDFLRKMLPADVGFWKKIEEEVFPGGIDPTDTEGSSEIGEVQQTPDIRFDPSASLSEDLPGIANDRTDGKAYINIKADVESLARVMCMRQVKPPLSIALFGQWGSGKSFFMAQLKNQVEAIKKTAVTGREGKAFYKDIIQIDFNAWHYVEANLWASLVSHIFETLKSASGKPHEWKEQIQQLLNQMGAAKQSKQSAEENLEAAKKKAGEAQQCLIIKQNDAQIKLQALQGISTTEIARQTKLDALVEAKLNEAVGILGLAQARQAGGDVARTLGEAKKFATETAAFVRVFWRAPGFGKRVCFIVCAVVAPLVTPALMNLLHQFAHAPAWSDLAKTVTSLTVMGASLLGPLLGTKKTAEEVVASIRKASDDFDNAVAAKEAEERRKVQAGVSQANAELEQAKKALTEAEDAVEKARKALAEALPARALMAFIEERSASGDYRKSLGTLALVRDDFDKLSVLMRNAREANEGTLKVTKEITKEYIEMVKSLPSIDRIILYIDDLDRCPPKQVIQVLEAIQLLLAFDLFVVVVGVDPRWISRSLTKYYPELLSNVDETAVAQEGSNGSMGSRNGQKTSDMDSAARPLDYLEKIFQIPFWLKPLGNREAGILIRGLLSPSDGENTVDKTDEKKTEPKGQQTGVGEKQSATKSNEGGVAGVGSTTNTSEGSPDAQQTKAKRQESGSKEAGEAAGFESVKLTDEEAEFLSRFERLAGPTPRAIKRFVNIYRLLRARVSKEREREFLGKPEEPREFEAVMYLLAMFNSVPGLAQRFWIELEGNGQLSSTENLGQPPARRLLMEVLDRLEAASSLSEAERDMLASMRIYVTGFGTRLPTTEAYYCWFPVVARHSFVGQFPQRPTATSAQVAGVRPGLQPLQEMPKRGK